MKQKNVKALVCAIACSSFLITAKAQDPINIVTTAVPFLRISPDARSGGMGDAGIALTPDASSGYWDLAKTPFASSSSAIGVTYTPWLKDIAQDVYMIALSGYHKLDDDQAFSAGIRYFNLGQIQFTDAQGNPLNTGRPREFAVDLGYSRKISSTLGVGVALRYINSALASGLSINGVSYKAGNAIAADISLFGDNRNDDGQGLTYGLAFSNLGSKIGYTDNAATKDYIPANLGIGVGYTWSIQDEHKFTLAAEVNKLLVPAPPVYNPDDTTGFEQELDDYHTQSVFSSWFKSFSDNAYAGSIGAEYTYNDQFSIRAGYYKESKQAGNRSFFTAGVGVKYQIFTFNFSYLAPSGNGITRNPLSNTLRFGVLFDLEPQQ
ncbi:MAG: type IX secretion system outer membrane channel protein PorV [Bacteroidetes bacterium]|nr:type IX secretion system outer membrane channel protein PorV [Bacteroidota bacterium]